MIKVDEFIKDKTRPENTVHYGKEKRFLIAMEQLRIQPVSKKNIIRWTNAFIKECDIKVTEIENQVFTKDITIEEFNKSTQERYILTNEQDIVWMKFANTGHLGVVACSNDVNFDIPPDANSYNERCSTGWKYNTAGIILHYLDCHNEEHVEWDKSFFLVFPLKGLKKGKDGTKRRHQIETGIGNYLLSKGVPILDYYSHRI